MISMAMLPGQYDVMHIAQWSSFMASCKATRCCHRVSAHATSHPTATMVGKFVAKHKTQTKHNF